MLSFDMSIADAQAASPLFNRIPGEIRDHIFELAVAIHTNKREPYVKHAYYYRPGFRYGDHKLDTALLRTCRRIYQETHSLPARNFKRVEWHNRAPPNKARHGQAGHGGQGRYHPELTSLQLFTQQCCLEGWAEMVQKVSHEAQQLRRLRITLRHSDWWSWEHSAPLRLDAKQSGTASMTNHSAASDGFDADSWGYQFRSFQGLKVFVLELETVEGKKNELDDIVMRAADWQFPLGDGNVLIMNAAKTKKTGWHGVRIPSGRHVPNDPVKAKERLEGDGVDFRVPDGEPEISEEDRLTYYVVALTYEARPKLSRT